MDQSKAARLENKIKKDYKNLAGIVALKNGETLYENYFNGCTAASRLHIYSVTKSVLSILLGIALDHGQIQSLDQRVLDFFPEYTVKKGEKMLPTITLRDMLTMTAPYKYRLVPPYIKYFTSDDWVKFSLGQLGGPRPGGRFFYAGLIGPDILSGILMRVMVQTVLDFARQALFEPLGIQVEQSIVFHSKEEQLAFNRSTQISGWAADPTGVNAAGWGLTLSPTHMAKLGQLYLNEGVWNGRRIVSADWVRESTTEHSRWEKPGLPYGYLWWVENGRWFAAMGDGGNILYVNTSQKIVVAITSLFKPNVTDRVEFIKEYIEPLLE